MGLTCPDLAFACRWLPLQSLRASPVGSGGRWSLPEVSAAQAKGVLKTQSD